MKSKANILLCALTLCLSFNLCACGVKTPEVKVSYEPISCDDSEDYTNTEAYTGSRTSDGISAKFYNYAITSKLTDSVATDTYEIGGYDFNISKNGEKLSFDGQLTDMSIVDGNILCPLVTNESFDKINALAPYSRDFITKDYLSIADFSAIVNSSSINSLSSKLDFTDYTLNLCLGLMLFDFSPNTENSDNLIGLSFVSDESAVQLNFGLQTFMLSEDSDGHLLLSGKDSSAFDDLPRKTRGKQLIKIIEPTDNVHIVVLGDDTQQKYAEFTIVSTHVERSMPYICSNLSLYDAETKKSYCFSLNKEDNLQRATYSCITYLFDNINALSSEKSILNIGKDVLDKVTNPETISGDISYTMSKMFVVVSSLDYSVITQSLTAERYDATKLTKSTYQMSEKLDESNTGYILNTQFATEGVKERNFSESLSIETYLEESADSVLNLDPFNGYKINYVSNRDDRGEFSVSLNQDTEAKVVLSAATPTKKILMDFGDMSGTRESKLSTPVSVTYDGENVILN